MVLSCLAGWEALWDRLYWGVYADGNGMGCGRGWAVEVRLLDWFFLFLFFWQGGIGPGGPFYVYVVWGLGCLFVCLLVVLYGW